MHVLAQTQAIWTNGLRLKSVFRPRNWSYQWSDLCGQFMPEDHKLQREVISMQIKTPVPLVHTAAGQEHCL